MGQDSIGYSRELYEPRHHRDENGNGVGGVDVQDVLDDDGPPPPVPVRRRLVCGDGDFSKEILEHRDLGKPDYLFFRSSTFCAVSIDSGMMALLNVHE
jgi:hypothetical protein